MTGWRRFLWTLPPIAAAFSSMLCLGYAFECRLFSTRTVSILKASPQYSDVDDNQLCAKNGTEEVLSYMVLNSSVNASYASVLYSARGSRLTKTTKTNTVVFR